MELSQCDRISVVKKNTCTILHGRMQEHESFLGLLKRLLPSAAKKKPKEKYKESMDRPSNRSLVFSIYWVGDHLRLQAVSFEQIPLFTLGATSPIHCSFPSKSSFLNILLYACHMCLHALKWAFKSTRISSFQLIILMLGTSKWTKR